MNSFSSLSLFAPVTALATALSICSSSWISMWAAMEINMLSFIPLMKSRWSLTLESMVKYLLIQTSFSTLILSSIMAPNYLINLLPITFMAILIKLGAAPFHNWLLMVVKPLNWTSFSLISTLQKLIPLFMISTLLSALVPTYMMIFILAGLAWGAVMGLNQSNLRILLTASSITHMSWMIFMISLSPSLAILYTSLYFIILFNLLIPMAPHFKANPWNPLLISNSASFFPISLCLLSMAGLPPLLGFFMKWAALSGVIICFTYMASPMIISSMISLVFYFMVSTSYFFKMTAPYQFSSSYVLFLFFLPNLLSLPIFISLFTFKLK